MQRRPAIALILLTLGCSGPDTPKSLPVTVPQEAAANSPPAPRSDRYSIIKDQESKNPSLARRNVDVRLKHKVSTEELSRIAEEIRASETRPHELTFIFYYLPAASPRVKEPPWASSHFEPKLTVQIMGATIEEERSLKEINLAGYGPDRLAWFIDVGSGPHLAVFYPAGDGMKMDTIMRSGARSTDEMIELVPGRGRRFRKAKGTDVYEIDKTNALSLYADDGDLLFYGSALPN